MNPNIGKRIFRLRKERGWNQAELAQRAGVTSGYISLVEAGERGLGLPAAIKLARAFGLTIDALIATDPQEAASTAA